jgi:hypothetical protein
METEEVLKLKKDLIELSHRAMELEENLYRSIKYFPEPKMTDVSAWWCGFGRVMNFACWSDAHKLWTLKTKGK